MSTIPPDFSEGEIARRRTSLLAAAGDRGADVVVAYGANRSGSAVPWLTRWPVTREAAVVLRRDEAPHLLVGFANHVPNAARIAADCAVSALAGPGAVLDAVGRSAALGVVGQLPAGLHAALCGAAAVVGLDEAYVALRQTKSPEELAHLRHAAALTDASAGALVAAAVPGATELDLVAAVESAYAGTGATNHIHYVAATSMAAPDRCVPSQWPTDRRLDPGSVVVFELSTTWGPEYPGQVLRTVMVDAEPTPLYRGLHDVANAALAAIVARLRPGALPTDLLAAADVVPDAGFVTVDDLVHGLGGGYLPPVLSHRTRPSGQHAQPLREGMTLVVQPNVCTPDLTAGVQTGELFEITADGARSLHRFPAGLLRGGPR